MAAMTSCAGDDEAATTTAPTGPESTTGVASDEQTLEGVTFEVHHDPGCGCCTNGANVELSEDADRVSFRAAHGIDDAAASCHTAVVEGYAIEGHVPISAIQRLLADRPDAFGLALPGMPSDSPGMGGDPASWEHLPVMVVTADGELSPYEN